MRAVNTHFAFSGKRSPPERGIAQRRCAAFISFLYSVNVRVGVIANVSPVYWNQ